MQSMKHIHCRLNEVQITYNCRDISAWSRDPSPRTKWPSYAACLCQLGHALNSETK